jgi:hypothetical protein
MDVPLPGASASDGCGLHSPQRLRSLAVARAAFAMLNVAAPTHGPLEDHELVAECPVLGSDGRRTTERGAGEG